MIGMVGKDGIEAAFSREPVAVIRNSECEGRLCVRVGRVQRQCTGAERRGERLLSVTALEAAVPDVVRRRPARPAARVRLVALLSACVGDCQQTPSLGIVRCDGHRAFDQGKGLVVLRRRSSSQSDASFLDEPRRFRVGRRRAEFPPRKSTGRQRGRAASQ